MKKTLILTLTLCLVGMLAACGTASGQPANTPLTDTLSESTAGNPQTEQPIVASDLKPSEGLEFESNGDGTCTLVGIGICKDADLVIPTESPDGETLTVIEEDAFMGLEDVSSVTLLNGNYEVEDRAFQYGEITEVHIVGGTPIIGDSAFSTCEDLTRITFQDCNIQLGEYAFLGCGKDAEVVFTNCTGTVDKYAFQYSDLASLSIDQCDLNIAKSAFASCEALTAITFQNSTLTSGEYAFFGVGDKAVVQADNCALTLDNWAFQYASLSELTITGDKAELGDAAFGSCEDLTAVTIDCPTVTLGEYALSGCDDLTTISICDNGRKDNTITIDNYAFQYNDKLTSVTVGNGTVETGEYLFSGCPDDLSVSIAGKDYMTLA